MMVINCHERLARYNEQELTPNFTPVAQYLRGLTYSLPTQIMNAEAVFDRLAERSQRIDDGSLLDDKRFTRSHMYRWAVKHAMSCAEAAERTVYETWPTQERASVKQEESPDEDGLVDPVPEQPVGVA